MSVLKYNLKGKRVIITGGANGIGRAIVEKFCHAGAHVTAIDRDAEALKKLQDILNSYTLTTIPLDITNGALVSQLLRNHSNIDVLVNNAGVDLVYNLAAPNWENWEKVMTLNLSGTRHITEVVISDMLGHGRGGSIIFITSVHTALAFIGGAAYDASKHALVGLMRVLALEYGSKGICVNAVAPGLIYPTNITSELGDNKATELGRRVPIGRYGHPKEIANVCAFLASDDASYINGAEIRVDGGLSIKNVLD